MNSLVAALVVGFIVLLGPLLRRVVRRRRRLRISRREFPEQWLQILRDRLPCHDHLPPGLRSLLHEAINIFLAEKHFEGCGGLELSDEIRVSIAAWACLPLLGMRHDFYPRLTTILVYPAGFHVRDYHSVGDAWVEQEEVRDGESWHEGMIVLAWDQVEHAGEGYNVVIHECAHQLDQETGVLDGTPALPRALRSSWNEIMTREFKRLQISVRRNRPTFLDPYGSEHPTEFFAVVLETFFDLPGELRERHPDLYGLLSEAFGLDPASWTED